VVLDSDPLTVDPAAVGRVKVVETIKRGHSIYRAS
jgi:predicted amidohydrolase YtcJ